MITRKFLIAGGNATLLVWDCPVEQRKETSLRLLAEVEQVGFIEPGPTPALTMMGSELCINSTIAFANTLGGAGQLRTSGLDTPVEYENHPGLTTVRLGMATQREGDVVLLSGIGFECRTQPGRIDKTYVAALADRYGLPAFGVALMDGPRLTPYVYVKETDSLVEETACGSGSIAASLTTGVNEILQPTGETITVRQEGNHIFVSAKVTELF